MAYRPQLGPLPPSFPLRVFVHSADALVAEALQTALGADARLICVAAADEAEVVVWDLGPTRSTWPTRSQLDAAQASASACACQQALLALVPDESALQAALALGANGVLLRRAHAPSLAAAIVALRLGLCVLDVALAEEALSPHSVGETMPLEPSARDHAHEQETELEPLTLREHEVLAALALGLSNRAIAERLSVSVHTVKFHVNAILAKLAVESRAGAVAKALRHGLVRA